MHAYASKIVSKANKFKTPHNIAINMGAKPLKK